MLREKRKKKEKKLLIVELIKQHLNPEAIVKTKKLKTTSKYI